MDALGVFHVESLRRLGFFVVVVDGRGTPNRSRQFREAGYPVFYDIQVEDHAAAIEQLAEQFEGMDVERVGIWGSSNGGAGAARAILRRPDFFKVAVSSAGSHDYASLPPSGIKYFGVPSYSDGTAVRPSPGAVPENYSGFDNAALAGNLKGDLLLAYGDMDNYALPTATHRLVNALIKAGKTFDVLPMYNHGHFFLFDPYFKRRLVEYFVEHLHGVRIPAG
jgi:dipeptidyl aminopeptidase/acylaminoacyl peptidase